MWLMSAAAVAPRVPVLVVGHDWEGCKSPGTASMGNREAAGKQQHVSEKAGRMPTQAQGARQLSRPLNEGLLSRAPVFSLVVQAQAIHNVWAIDRGRRGPAWGRHTSQAHHPAWFYETIRLAVLLATSRCSPARWLPSSPATGLLSLPSAAVVGSSGGRQCFYRQQRYHVSDGEQVKRDPRIIYFATMHKKKKQRHPPQCTPHPAIQQRWSKQQVPQTTQNNRPHPRHQTQVPVKPYRSTPSDTNKTCPSVAATHYACDDVT